MFSLIDPGPKKDSSSPRTRRRAWPPLCAGRDSRRPRSRRRWRLPSPRGVDRWRPSCREDPSMGRSPADPSATSVTPLRHTRPKVSVINDGHVDAGASRNLASQPPRRSVRILRQQHRRAVVGVGEIDAGVGVDEAVASFGDAQRAATTKDAHRLTFDDAHLVLVAAVIGNDLTLGLRDDFARHDDQVVVDAASSPASSSAVSSSVDEVVTLVGPSSVRQQRRRGEVRSRQHRRGQARAFSGSAMIVVVTSTRDAAARECRSASARSASSMIHVPTRSLVELGDAPGRWCRSRVRAGVDRPDPSSAAPSMMRRDRDDVVCVVRARPRGPRGPGGSDRWRSGDWTGRSPGGRRRAAPQSPRRWPGVLGARRRSIDAHHDVVVAVDEVLLKGEPSLVGEELRREWVVGHGQDCRPDARGASLSSAVTSVLVAPSCRRWRAIEVRREVAVAQSKPGFAPECVEFAPSPARSRRLAPSRARRC